MSTNDVPGHVKSHNDELGPGCWAEHQDGSLILVKGLDENTVFYEIYNMSESPPVVYTDAMPETGFKKHFSWDGSPGSLKWTWHDKTPFPFKRVIRQGGKDGTGYASGDDIITAAMKVIATRERFLPQPRSIPVADLEKIAQEVSKGDRGLAKRIKSRLQSALDKLGV